MSKQVVFGDNLKKFTQNR